MEVEHGESSRNFLVDPSHSSTPLNPYLHQGLILPTGRLARGAQLDGRMSPIRRFFCLFVTFDLLLCSLLWLITLTVVGNFNPDVIIEQQIFHYSIRNSFFDNVMASASRFVILILFYGVLNIDHWIIVALTTAGTGVFVVAKVLLYDWSDSATQVINIMVLLTSFIISWAEAWLLDIKVVPSEKFARDYLSPPPSVYGERTPLLPPFYQRTIAESYASFYSPVGSDRDDLSNRGVDEEVEEISEAGHIARETHKNSNGEYIAKGEETVLSSWELLNCDEWTIVKELQNESIYCHKLKGGRKIFKVVTEFHVDTTELVYILFNRIEDLPKWNFSVKSSQIMQVIDDSTDITRQVSKEVGKGIISSREYITLRHIRSIGSWKVIASVSTPWPKPHTNKPIRGEIGPSCWAIKPSNDSSCEVRWLLDTQINGWIPSNLVESALIQVMADTITSLRNYCSSESHE